MASSTSASSSSPSSRSSRSSGRSGLTTLPFSATWRRLRHAVHHAVTATLRGVAPVRIPLTSTVGGVEVGLLRTAAALRLLVLVQAGVVVALDPELYVDPDRATGLYLGVLLLSVVVLAGVLTGSRPRRRWFSRADLVLAGVVLVAMPAVVGPNQLIGSWTAWGQAFGLTALVLGAVLLPHLEALAWSVALAVVYLVSSRPGFVARPKPFTAGVNVVGMLGCVVLTILLVDFLRRLGSAADTTVRSAAQVAAEEERDRARRLLHDHASLLAVVADRVDDAALRRQSRAAAHEISAFLAGPAGWDPQPDGTVADVVREAAAPFADLPLTVSVELAARTRLGADEADALAGAVTTLLHNVRTHAHARSVVVHADVDEAGDGWEVTVRDDGVGFDPTTTPRGFGLGRQVGAAAARAGLEVDVESAPGEGTLVRLRSGAGADGVHGGGTSA